MAGTFPTQFQSRHPIVSALLQVPVIVPLECHISSCMVLFMLLSPNSFIFTCKSRFWFWFLIRDTTLILGNYGMSHLKRLTLKCIVYIQNAMHPSPLPTSKPFFATPGETPFLGSSGIQLPLSRLHKLPISLLS